MKIKEILKKHKIKTSLLIIILLLVLYFPIRNQFARPLFIIQTRLDYGSNDRYYKILSNGRFVRTQEAINFDNSNIRTFSLCMCMEYIKTRRNRGGCINSEVGSVETDFDYFFEEAIRLLRTFNQDFWRITVFVVDDIYILSVQLHLAHSTPNYIYQFNPNTNKFNRLGILRNREILNIKPVQ